MNQPGQIHSIEQRVDLRRLAQFVVVVESGSLTDAAAELRLTQQAISASVRALEDQVGVQLFTRKKGMHPSAAGHRLYESAKLLLAGADQALAAARAAGSQTPEVLRVGHTPAISSVNVFDVIGARLPTEATLHSLQMFPRQMLSAMMAGEIDLALRRSAHPPRGLSGAVIGFDRLNVAFRTEEAPPGPTVGLTELVGRQLILWSQESRSPYSAFLLAQCRRSGFEPQVQVSRFQGIDPLAAPLTTTGAFALVAQSPGAYLDGRVRVLAARDRITTPLQALWLPTAQTGLVAEIIQRLVTDSGNHTGVEPGWPEPRPTDDETMAE